MESELESDLESKSIFFREESESLKIQLPSRVGRYPQRTCSDYGAPGVVAHNRGTRYNR